MLIIAIPKSCSTSLASTFADINHLSFLQTFHKQNNNNKCKSNNLYRIHSDMIEYKESEINKFVNSNVVYKQHIFPSENNLNLIKKTKCVILLRKPEHVINSYRRAYAFDGNHAMNKFQLKKSDTYDTYLATFMKFGLYEDLVNFNKRYEEIQSCNHLIIYKDDIINDTDITLNKINDFFGFQKTSNIKLLKKRYVP